MTIYFEADITGESFRIGTTDGAAATFTFTIDYAEGSLEDPVELVDGDQTINTLAYVTDDGEIAYAANFVYTASEEVTVVLSTTSETKVYVNGSIALSSEGSVSVSVAEGDEVSLFSTTQLTDYPLNITFNATPANVVVEGGTIALGKNSFTTDGMSYLTATFTAPEAGTYVFVPSEGARFYDYVNYEYSTTDLVLTLAADEQVIIELDNPYWEAGTYEFKVIKGIEPTATAFEAVEGENTVTFATAYTDIIAITLTAESLTKVQFSSENVFFGAWNYVTGGVAADVESETPFVAQIPAYGEVTVYAMSSAAGEATFTLKTLNAPITLTEASGNVELAYNLARPITYNFTEAGFYAITSTNTEVVFADGA